MEDVLRPEPGAGQVLVRLLATGVNFAETERRRGTYMTPAFPWCPGSEGAGHVVGLGPGVSEELLEARVAFWVMPPAVSGTYAEYAVAPVDALFRLPESLSFEVGAALPLQGLTAYGLAFFASNIRAGMSVLVHAAAGGIGQLLTQLVLRQGGRVLGTTSTGDKAEVVAALGAEALVHGPDLCERINAVTEGRGVDLVFDSIGRVTQAQSLEALAPYGELIHFGEASGAPAPIHPDQLYDRCLKVSAFGLDVDRDPTAWSTARHDLLQWVERGELKLSISLAMPLAEAAEAHRLLESRATTGKVILLPAA